MTDNQLYRFTSARLGFRNWIDDDIDMMTTINSDQEVMQYFPSIQSKINTVEFIKRMQYQYNEKGFCYFAVDRLDTKELIGFIGLSEPSFESSFTPCIDIGWRLHKNQWHQGFAREGAARCIEFAWNELHLKTLYAFAPKINIPSENVMIHIGMKKISEFQHPLLLDYPNLKDCVVYKINNHNSLE